MTDFENFNESRSEARRRRREMQMNRIHDGQGHVWTGVFLLLIGGVALARSFGADIPRWLYSWQMLLIVIGLFIGFRKGFRDGGWFVPILIGGAFLVNNYFLNGNLHRHMWPLILIIIGSFFIFRSGNSRSRWRDKLTEKKNTGTSTATQAEIIAPISEDSYGQDDYISVTSIFGGTEKTILSKNFKGGNMVNIFGGSEIIFTQADINGTAILDVTCIFGGATLIVPSHWVVKSEAVTIFGGIGDKRKNIASMADSAGKALVVKGTILFGGLEIKSF